MSRLLLTYRMSLTIGVGLIVAASTQAAILSHSGQNDPGTEGWTAVNTSGSNSVGVAPDSTPSWQIVDGSTSNSPYYENVFAGGDLASITPWVQTVKLRVDSSSSNIGTFSAVYDGATFFQFFYSTSELRYFDSGAGHSSVFNVDNSTDFRTYQFAYDPVNDEIDISLDSIYQTSLARAAFFNAPNTPAQYFGGPHSTSTSDARWAIVTLTPVPEPASVGLLATGCLAAFVIRRRQRA